MKAQIRERSFEFACRIVSLYEYLQKRRGAGRVFSKQILRSGTSIGANVEEASAGQSRADFISKYSIASKEARETYYWLRLLAASDAVPHDRIDPLIKEANEIVAILTTIVRSATSGSNLKPQPSNLNPQT